MNYSDELRLPGVLKRLTIFSLFFTLVFGCSEKDSYLPEKFRDYEQSKILTGKEAKDIVDHLHMKEVTPAVNRIGIYKNDHGPLTIYISEYANPEIAEAEMKKMSSKLSEGNSEFIGGDTLAIGGKQLLRYFGFGQTHYIFTDRANLLWISANTVRGQSIIEDYLEQLH